MLVYVMGIIAVAFLVGCLGLAQEGSVRGGEASIIGVGSLLGLSSIGLLLSVYLMLSGCSENCSAGEGWWNQSQGQQFVAALLGWLLLALATFSVRQRQYLPAIALLLPAACLFGLWGLLVEAGWSDRGPLAIGRFVGLI